MTIPRIPDPSLGVFETLLVLDGRPVELDAHLDRAAASLEALFGAALPSAAAELVSEHAAALPLGRLRLTIAPGRDGLRCEATATAIDPAIVFPIWDRGAELRGLPFPRGLGPHKLVDRPGLPNATGATVPLLFEADGELLEAGRANVFVVRGGTLATPMADGRILPGITRAAVLEIARRRGIEVAERAIGRAELLEADEVFLTGSVRGVEPARSLDGTSLAAGEVSATIAAGLSERYRTSRTAPALASRSA